MWHTAASTQLVLIMWGRLVTCGGLIIRLVWCPKNIGPIANRPQVSNLPHNSSFSEFFTARPAVNWVARPDGLREKPDRWPCGPGILRELHASSECRTHPASSKDKLLRPAAASENR